MENQRAMHERPHESVRVLLELLAGKELDERYRFMMIQDFITKCANMPLATYSVYLSKLLRSYAPKSVQDLIKDDAKIGPLPQKVADVGIVTIIPEELTALKNALDIDLNRDEDYYSNGLRFWETSLLQAKGQHELRIVITMVGEARTVPCAVACGRFFRTYDVGACLLVGIAAGLKGKVRLGDVIVSETILDYEGQRLAPSGPKKRPTANVPESRIQRDFQYFSEARKEWGEMFLLCYRKLRRQKATIIELPRGWRPSCDTGVILAGEKMLEDGSLPEMREEYHDKVRAAEMEGSGFVRACREYGIPWLVFRGISDFGDKAATRVRREWKLTSALSAATLAVSFLKHGLKQLKEEEF